MTEPFFVGTNNLKFKGVSSDGFLQALEPEELKSVSESIIVYMDNRKLWQKLQELEGMLKHVHNHYETPKRKSIKYNKYIS